jgi:hypothetical protein
MSATKAATAPLNFAFSSGVSFLTSCSKLSVVDQGVRPEILGERFGDPGGPDPGEATSSAARASSIRKRAAQELNPEMGRMGAEDPSRAFRPSP